MKRYRVVLAHEERERLEKMISSGRHSAQVLTRVRIVLKADEGRDGPGWSDGQIQEALEVGRSTVERTRRRWHEGDRERIWGPRQSRRVYRRKLDGVQEAHLIALACSAPPEGRARWTVRLLADRMVQLGQVESIAKTTVHDVLKKTSFSRGSKSNGVFRPSRMRNSSGGWKTCWTCTDGPKIRPAR